MQLPIRKLVVRHNPEGTQNLDRNNGAWSFLVGSEKQNFEMGDGVRSLNFSVLSKPQPNPLLG